MSTIRLIAEYEVVDTEALAALAAAHRIINGIGPLDTPDSGVDFMELFGYTMTNFGDAVQEMGGLPASALPYVSLRNRTAVQIATDDEG